MAPSVTVVISTRDRWPLLARTALAAALLQEDVELEVVVVDDGSTDPAPRGLTGLDDPRVRVIRHERARGVAAARNAGIRSAGGNWVAVLDDDDLWAPEKLSEQVAAAAALGAGFAYSAAVWVDESLELIHGHAPPSAETLSRELLRWNVLWGGASNVVARRELLAAVHGFDEELFQLADWDLWVRLAAAAPAVALADVHVALLVHRRSMLLTDRRDVFVEFDRFVAKHADARAAAGVDIDRARFARWAGSGELRAGRRRAAARAFVRGSRAPANLVRAAAAVLGPRPFAAASRLRAVLPSGLRAGERVALRPAWLELYR